MLYILTVTYTAAYETVEKLFPAHREFLAKHYASGEFIVSGVKTDRAGGVIVAKVDGGRERVDAILADDPFVLQEVGRYDVVEFKPLWTAAGLDWLKAASS